MRRHVVDAASGLSMSVEMSDAQILEIQKIQAAAATKATTRLQEKQEYQAALMAQVAFIREQMEARAKDADAPAEIKNWHAMRKARE